LDSGIEDHSALTGREGREVVGKGKGWMERGMEGKGEGGSERGREGS